MTDLILDRIWTTLEAVEPDVRRTLTEAEPELDAALRDAINDAVRDSDQGTDQTFEFELSDFKFITAAGGRALRLTLTWKFHHPQYGLLGASTEGCLVMKQRSGGYRFSPPVSKFAPHQSKVLTTFTTDLHDAVLARIANWKTAKGVGYLDYLTLREENSSVLPGDVDPDLPLEMVK